MPITPRLVSRIIDRLQARWAEDLRKLPPEAQALWGDASESGIDDGTNYGTIDEELPDLVAEDYRGWEVSDRLSTNSARSFAQRLRSRHHW